MPTASTTPRVGAGRAVAMVAAATLALVGCTTASSGQGVASAGAGSKIIRVVAAENFWGSIAVQLGGRQVAVRSIIDNPATDPHDYEPTAADGRAIASADLVLSNGIGYDTWAGQLAAATPVDGRLELTVGTLLGVAVGGNPHRWYNPDDVQRVIDELVVDFQRIDPADASYFLAQKAAYETTALADYKAAVADIRAKYAGTPIGASESIVAMIAPSLGLDLVTPADFLTAISQGSEPTAVDKATSDSQIKGRQIKVYVYNRQNATPDVQAQIDEAKIQGIPITTITETMTPSTTTWQQWQTAQLGSLRAALAEATGR